MAFLLRRVARVEVDGDSMLPTLLPGDRLFVVHGLRPRPGDLVTLPDPRSPARVVVKRVTSVAGEGADGARTLEVRGDNPDASTDSRTFGPVPARSIRGRVGLPLLPRGAAGPTSMTGPDDRQWERYASGDVV